MFVRADLNAPLDHGTVTDDTRLRAVVPTIQHALKAGAAVVLASHLGRPKGKVAPEFSLRPIAERLESLLGQRIELAQDCVGPATLASARALPPGQVLLLENLRFHAEEEANDDGFARSLAELAECYVDDAFVAAHRAHASIARDHEAPAAGCRRALDAAGADGAGRILESPERPLVAIPGGAKVSEKPTLVEHLLEKVDALLIGGGMAFTFLARSATPSGARSSSPTSSRRARRARGRAPPWRGAGAAARRGRRRRSRQRAGRPSGSEKSRPVRWGSTSGLAPSSASPQR